MMKSRKFQFALLLVIIYVVLLVIAKIDQATFAALMGTLVPLYFAANVAQKVWAPQAEPVVAQLP